MKTKPLIYSCSIMLIFIVFLLRAIFITEIRFIKEEYLIKKNYNQNIENFQKSKSFLHKLPDLEINFINKTDVEIQYRPKENRKLNLLESNLYFLFISDTSAYLKYKDFGGAIVDFWIENNSIKIKNADSIHTVAENFNIQYIGNLKSNNSERILEIIEIDTQTINRTRDILRGLNCFGYSKDLYGNIIIHFRTTENYMFDVFSYVLIPPMNHRNEIHYFQSKHGKINNSIYWYHFENIHVSYSPYMRLSNRNI